MKIGVASAGVAMALICCISAWGQRDTAAQILNNTQVWGRDFAAMFPYFQTWLDSGESELLLQGDVIKGMRVYKSQEDADRAASLWRSALPAPAPNWIQMRVINAFPDIGYQLAIQAPSLLLREGLTLQQIVSQFGSSQQVRERVITTQDREVKPISLREYSYANGAIVFAVESDSQAPDTIEMAFLNVPAVKAALSSEGFR
jgi:hypothetical protein